MLIGLFLLTAASFAIGCGDFISACLTGQTAIWSKASYYMPLREMCHLLTRAFTEFNFSCLIIYQ